LLAGGVGGVFFTLGTVTERGGGGEVLQFFWGGRLHKRIGVLSKHYLVCGVGRIVGVVCRRVASKPPPLLVIEQQEERIREAEANQYLVLQGDATEEKTLLAAGVRQARGLFAALATDAGNVFITLTAKELNPTLFVVARAETERSERTLLRSG